MNAKYTLNGIFFVWDRHKATVNRRKHGITFETACEAFFDPFVHYLDEEEVDRELRETMIGLTADWRLLLVVYVTRDESVKIISARLVTKVEREQYENQ